MKKLKILIIAILTLTLCLSAPLMISAEEPESVEESVSVENTDNSTPEEEKPAEAAPATLPEGAAPLKEDAHEHRSNKKNKSKDDEKSEEKESSDEE